MSISSSYLQNHAEFSIEDIVWEDDAPDSRPTGITFDYEAPAISVDTKGRFVQHEVIGGATVRQKVGEDPVQVSVSGVCKEPTARELDGLRDAKYGKIITARLPDSVLTVQFASVSTSPMDDSGAVALNDAGGGDAPEFLYTFDLSCVEVRV